MPRVVSGRVSAPLICVADSIGAEDCGKFEWQSVDHSFARASFNQKNDIF